MDDQDRQHLEELKGHILDELMKLAEDSDLAPEQKFELLINSAQIDGNKAELLGKAHDAAQGIEDTGLKTRALNDLLTEIDINLGLITTGEAEPKSQPENKEESQNNN